MTPEKRLEQTRKSNERYRLKKLKLIQDFGGKCKHCKGYFGLLGKELTRLFMNRRFHFLVVKTTIGD